MRKTIENNYLFIMLFFLLSISFPFLSQEKKNIPPYVPRQYSNVDDALLALKDCHPDPIVEQGRCHEDAVRYLETVYWKGERKILPKIMEAEKLLSGSPAEYMSYFLAQILEKETEWFINSMASMPADVQMAVAQCAARDINPNSLETVMNKLNALIRDKQLGQSAVICVLAILDAKEEFVRLNRSYECNKRPQKAPVGGTIWGMDCATNRLYVGDFDTRKETVIVLSETTMIFHARGGKLRCIDMKPGNKVFVWPQKEFGDFLDKKQPVEALAVLVQ